MLVTFLEKNVSFSRDKHGKSGLNPYHATNSRMHALAKCFLYLCLGSLEIN